MRGVAGRMAAAAVLLIASVPAPASPLALAQLTAGGLAQAPVAAASFAAGLPRLAHAARTASPKGWTARLERQCLALAVYHEARGERASGQFAVAGVVINRMRSRAYPESLCGVVYQNARMRNRCQFSFACDTIVDAPREAESWKRARQVADMMLCRSECGSAFADPARITALGFQRATHYHATYVAPPWSRKLEPLGRIGRHRFFASRRVLRGI